MFNLLEESGYSSNHLFEKINILNEIAIVSFKEGLEFVKNQDIKFVLVGGTAVVNYLKKGRDLTPDIDLLVYDINDVKRKLEESNIKYNELIDVFGKNIGITVPDFNIDFLKNINGKNSVNELIFKTSKKTNIGGVSVDIISPELLAILKIDLGREKDLSDGFALLSSGIVDKEKYMIIANGMKKVLNDYESIISYSEIIK